MSGASENQALLRKAVKDFVEQEIAPIAHKIDEEDTCPVELFPKTARLGFNGVFVPAGYGGAGLGYTEMAIVLEEIGRHSAGLAVGLNTYPCSVRGPSEGFRSLNRGEVRTLQDKKQPANRLAESGF